MMVVFEMHNAKKCCLCSGVAPQTPIPLYTTGQQRCFWIPRMGVFELHNAKKIVWVQGWRPKHPYLCTLQASKDVFGYLRWWCLKCTMPKKSLCSGVAPQTPIPLYPTDQQRCFWIPKMGVFELHSAKKTLFGFRGGAPNTHTSVPYKPAKVFSDTYDGGV